MLRCAFELNGKPMSLLKAGRAQYHAFSGKSGTTNKREEACRYGGPIPPGTYYVVKRGSGGLNWVSDWLQGKDLWFALYGADSRIDDEVFCNRVRRGELRLHPKGLRGISKGCVTVDSPLDFARLRQTLLQKTPRLVVGTRYSAQGILEVR